MTDAEILSHIDHTLLTPTASLKDVIKLCEEGLKYKTASVCIPPSYVIFAKSNYPRLNIGTVIGFPFGYEIMEAKLAEAESALSNGASELDMVINIGDVKNGSFQKVETEIAALNKMVGSRVLKVIVETCYLTQEEKIELCKVVTNSGADFIKTSTGLGPAGATLEDIKLFKEHIGAGVKMKAAGGIKTREQILEFLEAGCDRIGSSGAVKVICGL